MMIQCMDIAVINVAAASTVDAKQIVKHGSMSYTFQIGILNILIG